MAIPLRNLSSRVHPSELSPLISAITSCLKVVNPRNLNYSHINPAPLNQFSAYLDDSLVLQVINTQSNPYHALFFFNWASNPCPNPNNYTHNNKCFVAILDLLLSHSLFSIASSLLETSNKLSDFMISKFITANGHLGNVRAAIFWFHRAKTIGNGDCFFSCNAILGAMVRTNRIDLAHSFFDQIVHCDRVKPDVSTYTTMIRGYCKMGMVEKARKLFDEMPCKPNSLTCNTLIHGYCKKGGMESAKVIFYRMIGDSGCSPDTVTYTTLIDGHCKRGEFDEAVKWKSEMMNRGLNPNLLTYNALIYNLCLRGNLDEAKKLITKMRLNGVRENSATHLSILKGLSTAGKSDEVVEYFRERFRKEINPDAKAYAIVVKEYCKMKKPMAAISILKEMSGKGIKPDVSSFNSVFRTLMEVGEVGMATNVLKQMKKMGCNPNFISYCTVICNLSKSSGCMKEVEKVVKDMVLDGVPMDASIYSSLISGYCEAGDLRMATKVFGEAINKGCVVSLEAFTVFVQRLISEKKQVNGAENLLQEMCKRCAVADTAGYRQVLEDCYIGSPV
ncbi:Pentatricopeptide repeat-containing protein At5g39710 [Linum grandiflorum]